MKNLKDNIPPSAEMAGFAARRDMIKREKKIDSSLFLTLIGVIALGVCLVIFLVLVILGSFFMLT